MCFFCDAATVTVLLLIVHITDGKSQEHVLFQGVPQGSVLSRTLVNAVMA